ncbi:MAG TPA: alpha/beta hydrolase [Roseateles sp.]
MKRQDGVKVFAQEDEAMGVNKRWGLWALLGWALAAQAGERLEVPTRPGVTVPVFWEPAAKAMATVLLFPGGAGGFGQVESGQPNGRNYLVRAEGEFVARGYNVAILGRPSDTPDLGYRERLGDAHLTDLRAVLAFVKTRSPLPVWLVGTSRGTVSVTAAASRGIGEIAGVVLTSAITAPDKIGNVASQDLAAIRVPVLVLHHAKDQCRVTPPGEAPRILRGLTAAPVKKLVVVDGGGDPQGDPCEALHWHGFIGMEAEAVQIITDWMAQPVP